MYLIKTKGYLLLNKVIDKINNCINIYELDKTLPIVEIVTKWHSEGSYDSSDNKIVLKHNDDLNEMSQVLIHEIGHYLHYQLFDEKKFRWNQQIFIDLSGEKQDSYESFAFTFEQLIWEEYNENTDKMVKLLKDYLN